MIAGRYTLEREIGRGGMGAVWLGRDEVLGRRVALKRVGAAPGADTAALRDADLKRAEREARLAAQLNHPHVVSVYDLVVDGELRWLVMEYVDGEDLGALVRRTGRLDPDRAAHLARQAAEALAQAHEAGIVHRDVKPSNIMVSADGQVKLTDFGIARAEADATLTLTGMVTGSPAYLAPEVASGGVAGPPADVWALGATLFYALEGRPPYDGGDNVIGTMYKIVHEAPPRPTDPGWLEPLMRATMAVDPEQRWTMAQVRQFLTRTPTTEPVALPLAPLPQPGVDQPTTAAAEIARAPRPPRTRRPPVLPILLVLCALVFAVALAASVLNSRRDADRAVDPTSTPETGTASPTTSVEDPEERRQAMEQFVQDYVALAVSNPTAAFDLLTREFQDQSGGLESYREFWGDKQQAEVTELRVDPTNGRVAYRITYTTADDKTWKDRVSLVLVDDGDGGFLIQSEPA